MSLIIRPIKQVDKSQWLKLWNAPEDSYLEFYKALHRVSDEATENTWNNFFNESVPVYSVVAEVDGKVIGFANYLTHKNTWTIEDALYLNDLYVSQNNRLGGVGRKLIEYVYGEADKMNCKKVYWATSHDNHRAQLLYTKVADEAGKRIYIRPT